MRFIGCKSTLLKNIADIIDSNATGNEEIFCDLFSGTGTVARYFKPKYRILSNDFLHFSFTVQKATIENNRTPLFSKLRRNGIYDPFEYLEETTICVKNLNSPYFFITRNYSPHDGCERKYFSTENAARIDFIRNTIESWKSGGLLEEHEYYYLLAGLIESVPSVSNIAGTYGAYLKGWDKRAFKKLCLTRMEIFDNGKENLSFNCDANELIKDIEGDILYLDPPYNTRQYAPNYHLLETISRYDNPKIHGVTGIRPYQDEKSKYCRRGEVLDAFEALVARAKFSNVILSYSSEGLMSSDDIEKIMKRYGIEQSYQCCTIPYRRYKSKLSAADNGVSEYLFYIKKQLERPKNYAVHLKATELITRAASPSNIIKSPLNYIGGKYKLLPQILPLFPAQINTFADLFAGGCNVAINIKANKILCNDINSKIIDLFRAFQTRPLAEVLGRIEANISRYALTKENEEGFARFRDHYNRTQDPIDLYTLVCFSFNYQFRFNNELKYNNPFGRNRSKFSENMKENLIKFVSRLQSENVQFSQKDFSEISLDDFAPGDFIYCDPPYLITTGSYNDGNRGFKNWSAVKDQQLYGYLDEAHGRGIRFALSNVLEHKGKVNYTLQKWVEKYITIDLDYSYSNSSYNTSRGASKEVLIVNYDRGGNLID